VCVGEIRNQFPTDAGSSRGRIITGRPGAWMKEAVSKSTWWSLLLEARGVSAVR